MLRVLGFTTAGESHGRGMIVILEGLPSGLRLRSEDVSRELLRRQLGHGRGGRMRIERDLGEIMSGVRHGETMGSPITVLIPNRDYENWRVAMAVDPVAGAAEEVLRRVGAPRPGHADLVGMLKYEREDARDILERSSARETAARVAAGSLAKRLLAEFGIEIGSHVVRIGPVEAAAGLRQGDVAGVNERSDASPVRCLEPAASEAMVQAIDDAAADGDTLGGVFEVVASGLPVGLGSHVSWEERLDGRLAAALMSIQAMKGVEVGAGFAAARSRGSAVHDEIETDPSRLAAGGFRRRSNNAGGLEGGITTGEMLVIRTAMKPLSTLGSPLRTVDLRTGAPARAVRERSDVCAVPAAAVVGEAMVALVLADAMRQKFGGDSLGQMRDAYDSYLERLTERRPG
ncbi:MAG: chorismate synthase [Gemmatimonadota bacterium]|nr:MAG: chorismate synthase [Gemmatimonadota bacterium]